MLEQDFVAGEQGTCLSRHHSLPARRTSPQFCLPGGTCKPALSPALLRHLSGLWGPSPHLSLKVLLCVPILFCR